MVIGIVILHLPPYSPLSHTGYSAFDFIKAFFSHGVFRAAVPVLTALSGYLLFLSNIKAQPLELLVKKSSSILFPLIVWNLPIVILIFLSQKYNILDHEFSAELYPFNLLNWVNAITGFLEAPANYPLNFLRDLFIITLLSPLFWLFLKRTPLIGLAIVLITYYFNLEGNLILRNSMLVSFYLGGMAATQNWDLTFLDSHAKLCLILFLIFCFGIVLFGIENRELFRLISPILVWPSISLITNTRFGVRLYNNSRHSFFTFLFHGPLLLILWLVFNKIPIETPYPIFWLSAPILTIYISIFLSNLLKKYLPTASSIALGGR